MLNLLKQLQLKLEAANNYLSHLMEAQNIDTLRPDWTLPRNAYHNVRVLCDLSGLDLEEKNIICSCIYQESQFLNTAICWNRDVHGNITSTDWGIVQCNDKYHIGPGKDFPSVQWVLANPQAMVQWMIDMMKQGRLDIWVSFSSGAYQHWLAAKSPMWLLSS